MRRSHLITWAQRLTPIALAIALVSPPAQAEMDALVRQALQLAETGQARQAFDMLSAKETERAGDPDFDTVLGIAANEAGEFSRAIFALERVLLVQPDNARARAELGRALFAVGDTRGARALLEQTKSKGVPVEAAQTIDQFLSAIDKAEAEGKSSAKIFVEFGLGHDDNVNSGPPFANVAVPAFAGAILALNPGGIKTADSFFNASAGISGRYVLDPRWSLVGNASISGREHLGGDSSFDTLQADLNAGASYRVERNDYSLVAQHGTYRVGGNTARRSAGFIGEWVYRFDGFRQVTSYAQWARLTYPGQSLRDADRTVVGSSYAHLFASGLMAFAGAYIGTEKVQNSTVPHLGHDLWGLRAGVQKPFDQSLAVFATVGYENRDFGGADPLFLVSRSDQQYNLNLGVNWSPDGLWRVSPQLSYTRASSNVPVNDYSKRVLSVSARREF